MKLDLVVISGRTIDTEPCVVVEINGSLYMFNTPDGMQRVLQERKFKSSRVRQIFLTSWSHNAIGGLIGAILWTGYEKPKFGLTMSEATKDVVSRTITFVHNPDGAPDICQQFSDENVQIEQIPLASTAAFMVHLPDHPGKFMPEKARELGLKPGPMFSKLTSGQTVTLDDGRVVVPADVMTPSSPGGAIFVVDCWTNEDVKIVEGLDLSNVKFFVHFTNMELLRTYDYRAAFPSLLSNGVQHMCFSRDGRVEYERVFDMFQHVTGESLCVFGDVDVPDNFTNGHTGLSFSFALGREKFTKLFPERRLPAVMSRPLPEINTFGLTFLGTSARVPVVLRSAPAIIVHTKSGYILLDAGEGTLGQLRRTYGMANTDQIIGNLKMIWVSHLHADHLLGLPQVLEARARLSDDVIPCWGDQCLIDEMIGREKHMGGNFYKVTFMNRETIEVKCEGFEVKAVPVQHCEGSHGCILTVDNDYRIAYSGDRRIGDGFEEAVGECDVLIHEATFTDDMLEMATEAVHSTISEAVSVGKALKAKFTVLTHISNRYSHTELVHDADNVLFAFDHIDMSYENIPSLCKKYQNMGVDF